MGGKSGFRSYPKHLGKPKGLGNKQCDRSGFLRKASRTLEEYTGSTVAKKFADITPGFGTRHPQDVNQADVGGDESPIPGANPPGSPLFKSDLNLTDQEIEQCVRTGTYPGGTK